MCNMDDTNHYICVKVCETIRWLLIGNQDNMDEITKTYPYLLWGW